MTSRVLPTAPLGKSLLTVSAGSSALPLPPFIPAETGTLSNSASRILNAKKEEGKLTCDFQTVPSRDLEELENTFRKHSESLGSVDYGMNENPSKPISTAYHRAKFTL